MWSSIPFVDLPVLVHREVYWTSIVLKCYPLIPTYDRQETVINDRILS